MRPRSSLRRTLARSSSCSPCPGASERIRPHWCNLPRNAWIWSKGQSIRCKALFEAGLDLGDAGATVEHFQDRVLFFAEVEVIQRHRVFDKPRAAQPPVILRYDRQVGPAAQGQRPVGSPIRILWQVDHRGTSSTIFARMPGRNRRSWFTTSTQTWNWALTGSISGSRKTILPGNSRDGSRGRSTISLTLRPSSFWLK